MRSVTLRQVAWNVVICGCLVTVVGCGKAQQSTREYSADDEAAAMQASMEGDHHEHTAPHGGTLIPLGDHQFNAEVVFDDASRSMTLYVLDGHAETAVPIDATDLIFDFEKGGDEIEVTLTPKPADGEPEGMSSVFMASSDAIPGEVSNFDDVHGHVHITIQGEEFTGDLEHHHGEEDNDKHAHENGEKHEENSGDGE